MTHTDLPQTSFAVLGLLSFSPMSGYDLKQFADRSIGHFYWSPAKSQIYAELRRLRKAGLVTEEHIVQEGRPDKRVYGITPEGMATLAEWVNSSEFEQDMFKSTVMLRVFFGHSGDPNALIALLQQHLEFERNRSAMLREMERNCLASDENVIFSLLTIRAGIRMTEAGVKWSEESIRDLTEYAAAQASKTELVK